jgi:D-alanine-D-alanine ligase
MSDQVSSGLKSDFKDGDPFPHVVVAYNVVDDLGRGDARDLVAAQEVIQTARDIAAALQSAGCGASLLPVRALEDLRTGLAGHAPAGTLVFNLCEDVGGRTEDEPEVPRLLHALHFHYTGATPQTLITCLDKARTKRILQAQDVPTPAFQVCRSPRAAVRVPFPAIVKPVAEDASLGITADSVVTCSEQLRRQVAYVIDSYHQPALVEAFIAGREFNVGVWGNGTPSVLPLAELEFGDWPELERILHYVAKWDEESPEYAATMPRCPADVDDELAGTIRDVALRAYQLLECQDYARVDLRVRDGVPYVLEVNPNPCLAANAGFARAARAAGYDYAGMAAQIVRWAWARPPHKASGRPKRAA